jgi:caffeoyl-CoA O-methyltransferase
MSVEFDPLLHYIDNLSGDEDELLNRLNRETHLKVVNPRMLSGSVQGKFLEFISRMLQPKHILEIGTFTGYSAICLARGLQTGGKLVTIEKNDELSAYSQKYFKLAGLSDQIELWVGNALEIIPILDMDFDLVFIDGEKKEYPQYYQQVIEKMNEGSYLIADNVLWGGKVVKEAASDDPETNAIRRFNEMVRNDPRVDNVILSIRDGLNLLRKKT